MRVASGLLGAVMAALLLVSCGRASPKDTASKAAGSIASIAEPRKALAASAQLLAKESFALEYHIEMGDGDQTFRGSYRAARDGEASLVSFDGDALGEHAVSAMIARDGKRYFCFKGTAAPGDSSDGECHEVPQGDKDDAASFDFFFDVETMLAEAVDDGATISDAPDETINGIVSRCFTIVDDTDHGAICIARDDGRLVQMKGYFDGHQGEVTLVSSHKPEPSDFELPFPLVDEDLFGGSDDSGGTEAIDKPQPPSKPGLPAVRILGEPYPWEGSAACPRLENYAHYQYHLAVDDTGSIYIQDDEVFRKLDRDCTATEVPGSRDAWQSVAVGHGNVVYATRSSASQQGVILRADADGQAAIVAGKACADRSGKGCVVPKTPIDGPATEDYLGDIYALTIAPDGSVWFIEQPWDGHKMLDSRVRKLGTDGVLTTLPASVVAPNRPPDKIAVDSAGDAWILTSRDVLLVLSPDGKQHRFVGGTGTCLAVDASGGAWTYDSLKGELVKTTVRDTQTRYAYAPAKGAFCAALAFTPDGDLLFAGLDGLWRVDVP